MIKNVPEIVKSLILTLGVSAFILGSTEIGLRVFDVKTIDREFHVMVKSLDGAITINPEILTEDLTLLWSNRTSIGEFDERGFRQTPSSFESGEDKIKVLFLGDSVTYGWNLPSNLSYPTIFEEMGKGMIESYNGGVIGYSTFQGLKQLERFEEIHPDFVVVSFYQNDEDESCYTDREVYERNERLYLSNWLFRNSHTWRFLVSRTLDFINREKVFKGCAKLNKLRVSPAEYKDNLKAIIRKAREINSKVLLVAHPTNAAEYQGGPIENALLENYLAVLNRVGKNENVPVLEVPLLSHKADPKASPSYFMDHCHLTVKGSELMAKSIFEKLEMAKELALQDQ